MPLFNFFCRVVTFPGACSYINLIIAGAVMAYKFDGFRIVSKELLVNGTRHLECQHYSYGNHCFRIPCPGNSKHTIVLSLEVPDKLGSVLGVGNLISLIHDSQYLQCRDIR